MYQPLNGTNAPRQFRIPVNLRDTLTCLFVIACARYLTFQYHEKLTSFHLYAIPHALFFLWSAISLIKTLTQGYRFIQRVLFVAQQWVSLLGVGISGQFLWGCYCHALGYCDTALQQIRSHWPFLVFSVLIVWQYYTDKATDIGLSKKAHLWLMVVGLIIVGWLLYYLNQPMEVLTRPSYTLQAKEHDC